MRIYLQLISKAKKNNNYSLHNKWLYENLEANTKNSLHKLPLLQHKNI